MEELPLEGVSSKAFLASGEYDRDGLWRPTSKNNDILKG
jgi:hypothetical protein